MFKLFKKKTRQRQSQRQFSPQTPAPEIKPEATTHISSVHLREDLVFREERVIQTQTEIKIHSTRIYQMALYPESITEYEQYVLDHDMSIRRTYQKYEELIKQKGY
jgi:hypothetical protein